MLIGSCSHLGAVVAFAMYRVYEANSDPSKRAWTARWPRVEGFSDMKYDTLNAFYQPTDISHDHLMGNSAHIRESSVLLSFPCGHQLKADIMLDLEVLGTSPAYQKQGYGKALVKWGTDLADQLGVECYLDASPVGRILYTANGFVDKDVSAVIVSPSVAPMVRPAKPQVLVSG